MADLKTEPTNKSVEAFLKSVKDETKREECRVVLKLMKQITRTEPKMWDDSMVGFGSYHYKYASGREGDWFLTGFSPRKQNLTIYIMDGFDKYDDLLRKLGTHKHSKSCLYVNRLEDIDLPTLKELIKKSVVHMKKSSQ